MFSHNGTQFSLHHAVGRAGRRSRWSVSAIWPGPRSIAPVRSNLVYGGTNAYSKIVSHVKGGNGRAPLASILNGQLIAAERQNSFSGVGGNVIEAVYLNNFDLIAGGNINLTSGVNTLVLDAVGPDTQIHLRELPPPRARQRPPRRTATIAVVSSEGLNSSGIAEGRQREQRTFIERSSSSTTSVTRSRPGSRRPITNEGVTATYKAGGNGSQTLTAISGTFTRGHQHRRTAADRPTSADSAPCPAGRHPQGQSRRRRSRPRPSIC